MLWRTQANLATSLGTEISAAAFDLDVETPSDIIVVENSDGTSSYFLIMVSGREERELSASDFQTRQSATLQAFVDEQLTGNLQINDMWRGRVPTLPALDPTFLAAPAPTHAGPGGDPTDRP